MSITPGGEVNVETMHLRAYGCFGASQGFPWGRVRMTEQDHKIF
jgi:hypothetical protein